MPKMQTSLAICLQCEQSVDSKIIHICPKDKPKIHPPNDGLETCSIHNTTFDPTEEPCWQCENRKFVRD